MHEDSGQHSREKHSRFELQTLLETSRLLAESHNMDFVLNNLLLISMGKLAVPAGMVLLFEPAENAYVVSKAKGMNTLSEGQKIMFNLPNELRKHSQLTSEDKDLTASSPPLFDGPAMYSLFNLTTRDNHIGFLCLGEKGNKKPLKQHEIDFIESLTTMSSVAIANSRMFDELKATNRALDRKIHELNTLFDLSKDFSRMVDRREIVRVFKFAMLGQMLIRKFFVVLEENNERSLAAASSISGTLSEEEIDRLFSLREDVVTVDKELRKGIPFLQKNEICALISLYLQEEKTAVVGIGARANNEPYTKSDFDFLQSLGNLALLSVQKTILLEERIKKEQLEREIDIARGIQTGLFPHPVPTESTLDIAAKNVPSLQMGGDYFDVLKAPNNRLLIAIADVTGKGAPAALLMANLQAMLHVLLPIDISLEEAVSRINSILYRNTPSDKFVTFFWGVYNPETMKLQYVNAGHNQPLLFREGQTTCRKLDKGGLLLGALPSIREYNSEEITFHSGDLLVCYTDGVTEAMNKDKTEEYGEERLKECILAHRNKSAGKIMKAIIAEVMEFSLGIQYDDITLIVIKVR
jgi:sigma-B regulation protein RsbU (phosphoserine phosphatase)